MSNPTMGASEFKLAKYAHQLTPILFWTLSFIPINVFRYIVLGAVSASVLVYTAHHNHPSSRLGRLNKAMNDLEETFAHAKTKCARDYLALVDSETRFLRAKLVVSRLHSRLLKMHEISWKIYFPNLRETMHILQTCEHEVQELQIFMLLLVEAANQRKLTEDINQSLEIVDGISHSLSGFTRVHYPTSAPDCEI
ncbi:hypothetical protein MVEN_00196400 [Mycena venus]|uniref:Uncharacterized protein n=1 Tax=Mycena venus TaxID=2733690 RepID=A0A8H6Z0R8_9AGAR|nr:hypothetical protein MVEN_00196400 [Mycena venus]